MESYSTRKKVSAAEIQYSSKSMLDDFGRVFYYKDRVFRAISNNKIDYCLQLLESPLFKELASRGLVAKTWIADFYISDYDLVLEHEKLTQTLQHEWSFSMLKDAALSVLEVQRICNEFGFELKDAHTFNVLFRGIQPVWVDVGSIVKKSHVNVCEWIAYDEFLASFVIPLLFWARNMSYIARKLLESNFHRIVTIPDQSFTSSGLLPLLFPDSKSYVFRFRQQKIFATKIRKHWISVITDEIQNRFQNITGRRTQLFTYRSDSVESRTLSSYIPFNKVSALLHSMVQPLQETIWSGYHTRFYSEDGSFVPSKRFHRIVEIVQGFEGQVTSLIDLAGNEGYLSRLIASRTSIPKLILADYDENAIDSAYRTLKLSDEQRIHTVLLNFMFTPDVATTCRRLKCDIVLALAVTHHLILSAGFSLQCILERLTMFSNRYVMIEFMPLGLWSETSTNNQQVPDWYTINWFREHFNRYFSLLLEEQVESNRIIFVGELKFKECQ
jgi:hypothetical protein